MSLLIGLNARARLQPDRPSEDFPWWDSGIRRLSLSFKPAFLSGTKPIIFYFKRNFFTHSDPFLKQSQNNEKYDVGKMWGKNEQKRHPSYLEWRLAWFGWDLLPAVAHPWPPRAIIDQSSAALRAFVFILYHLCARASSAWRGIKQKLLTFVRRCFGRDSVGIRQNHALSGGIGCFTGRNNVI